MADNYDGHIVADFPGSLTNHLLGSAAVSLLGAGRTWRGLEGIQERAGTPREKNVFLRTHPQPYVCLYPLNEEC